MKKASAKRIPKEILDLIREQLTRSGFHESVGTGRWSFIHGLQKAVKDFIKTTPALDPQLTLSYPQGPSEDLLRRAFNLKSPPGATQSLRNLLSLFATRNRLDWNGLINEQFSTKYKSMLDVEAEDAVEQDSAKAIDPNNVESFATKIANVLFEKLSGKEMDFVREQMDDEKLVRAATEEIAGLYVPSLNDPSKPEFPPRPFYEPRFPASNTYRIDVPGFTNVWLKDESTNPTGTHKARMAWEVLIKAKRYNIKEVSIISSGSAAAAIQHFFNLFKVSTKLKVLMDKRIKPDIKDALLQMGCEVYETDLSKESLSSKEIKELTNNKEGIDITYREILDRFNDNYYDWLSYEVLNENPSYCFIPFGTGDLFVNILIIAEREFNNRIYKHDPRFLGDIKKIGVCNFMGATTRDANSRMDKLFSYYLPSLDDYQFYINSLIQNGRIGNLSGILDVDENFIEEALDISRKHSIRCEPSGIAGLALLLQMRDELPHDEKILIVNTGSTIYPGKGN
ncbi:MAG: PLP-dependent lyase/thiolase [Cyclobacteriaceae bacterium]|nr:PLP-dependent lyase/thiolase [Cyclobacteriaceae bacterium]